MGADAANPWTWLLGLPFPAQEESLLEVRYRAYIQAWRPFYNNIFNSKPLALGEPAVAERTIIAAFLKRALSGSATSFFQCD